MLPLNVITGDFDGDGVGDVTYTEKLTGSERLMIAFGGHDSIEPARFVSSFTDVIRDLHDRSNQLLGSTRGSRDQT